ncbi:TnpV protein [Yeguia hominis]|uniref:TnpV protein n=1 Tax=Yeguia hominis TaxID=2763662 RepID=UPI003D2E1E9B
MPRCSIGTPRTRLPSPEWCSAGSTRFDRLCRFLKSRRRACCTNLITSGKRNGYLAGIGQQAKDLFFRLEKQMAEAEGITEKMKKQ